jgi:alkyl hydroperoxide reductase subunit AhpC
LPGKKAMEDVEFKGRIPSKIKFPLVDDSSIAISKQYGMIHPDIEYYQECQRGLCS